MSYDRWGRTPEQAKREDRELVICGCFVVILGALVISAFVLMIWAVMTT